MDPKPHKLYHVHEFNSRGYLETYYSNKPNMVFWDDSKFMMEFLYKGATAAGLQGKLLLDISLGPLIHHLHPMSHLFEDIILLRLKERCIMELCKWLDMRTGAFDWSHATMVITELQGRSEQCEEKEEQLKLAIKQIMKCDLEKENPTDPLVLPQADCLVTLGLLDVICQNQDDYIRNLRKFLKFLKPGGHIIIIGVLNATYITVEGERVHLFSYDEDFVRKVLCQEKLTVDHMEVQRTNVKSHLTDYKAVFVLITHK